MQKVKKGKNNYFVLGKNILLLTVLFSIPILAVPISSCQKAEETTKKSLSKKSEYQEYIIDSLRAADRLEDLSKRVIQLLGEPRGVDKYSENPIYDEYHIKIYQDRLGLLNFNGEIIDDLKRFLDKYKDKPESKFFSYWRTGDIVQKMGFVDKYQKKVEGKLYREGNLGTEWYMLGVYLGEFVYDTFFLISHKEDFWLATPEDFKRMKEEAQKDLERAEKERARLLGEKLKGKK